MSLGILKVRLVAEIWDFLKQFRIARMAINTFSKIASASIELIQSRLGKLGLISAGVFATMAGGMLLLSKNLAPAMDLQMRMANIATQMRDKVGGAFSFVNKWTTTFTRNVLDMSAEFGSSIEDTAKGLYDILSATIPASEAMNVLAVSMRAAHAGLALVKDTTKAIISIMMSYNMPFSQAAKVSDVFFATIRRGITTMGELTPIIGRAAATAATAGVSFEELMAAISTMTRAGLDTGSAVTSINQILLKFFKPTDDAVKVAARLGMNMDLTTLKTEGLLSVMEKMSEILPENVGEIFSQMRALRGANALIQQITGFTEDYDIMLNSAGETHAAFAKQAQTLRFSLDRLKAGFTALRIEAVYPWLPVAKKFTDALNEITGAFRKISPEVFAAGSSILGIGTVVAGTAATVLLLAAAFKALHIAIIPILLVAGKWALIAMAIAAVVTIVVKLNEKFHFATQAADGLLRLMTLGIVDLDRFKAALKWLGEAAMWVGQKFGLLKTDWSELASSRELANSLKQLTEELDNVVVPTDVLQDRWKAVIESLRKGAPLTDEVKQGLAELTAVLKVTPVYSADTTKQLLELVQAVQSVGTVTEGTKGRIKDITSELSKSGGKNRLYKDQWISLLEAVSKSPYLTDEARKSMTGLRESLDGAEGVSGDLKDRIKELVTELMSSVSVSDAVRSKMAEITAAFNASRATIARLTAAFSILKVDMPQALQDTAKEADWAFSTIWRDGKYSASQLEKVWIEGFVPMLMGSLEKIPEQYRATTLKMTGYTLEMVQALATLQGKDVATPKTLQDEARRAAAALLTIMNENKKLPESQRVSTQLIMEQWDKVVKKIQEAFGEVPPEFERLSQAVASSTTSTLNSFLTLNTQPIEILKKNAQDMLEAFIQLESQTEDVLDPGVLQNFWETTAKAFEEAYGTFPDKLIDKIQKLQEVAAQPGTQPSLMKDIRAQFITLGGELEEAMSSLSPDAKKMWEKMVLIPEVTKQAGVDSWKDFIDRIEKGMTTNEWANYKRLEPMVKSWERAYDKIDNLADKSDAYRLRLLTRLLELIELAGGKYTDIWKRVYDQITDLNKSSVKSFSDMLSDVTTEIQRELSNAIEESIMQWQGASEKSMALVQMETDEKKRQLRDQLVEGTISQKRYYAELRELDRQFNEEKISRTKGFAKLYNNIMEGIKRYWIKLIADMVAQWITGQLKMLAVALKKALIERAADESGAQTKAVKSAAGIPFPLNIAAMAAAVAAVMLLLKNIPKFAEGGIATRPMLGMIAERGVSEAIIPLNSPFAKGLFSRGGGPTIFNDTFVFAGPTMVDDRQHWDRVYKEKVLPAKRRHLEKLGKVPEGGVS